MREEFHSRRSPPRWWRGGTPFWKSVLRLIPAAARRRIGSSQQPEASACSDLSSDNATPEGFFSHHGVRLPVGDGGHRLDGRAFPQQVAARELHSWFTGTARMEIASNSTQGHAG